jgi:predicted transcriptional regulator YdeE
MENTLEIVQVENLEIQGLRLRTCNADEMNPATAKIPEHVVFVDSNIVINYPSGARAYSVYFNYESDVNGNFDVLMGSNEVASSKVALDTVTIHQGTYLKFTSEGNFPEAVIKAWQSIWTYFNSPDCEHVRAYTTDFEHYENANKVSVYVAIKSSTSIWKAD